jgi:hypothetical protein
MLTSDGPKVVEFNARFGDPETQALMLLVTSDMYQSMLACSPLSPTSLGDFPVEFAPGMSAAAVVQASEGYPGEYEGPPLFVNSDAFVNIVMPALTLQNNDGPPLFVNIVMPALTLQNNDGPPLFVNSDAFVNIARLHIHMPPERSWYGTYQHGWCVRFERRAPLLSVWTLLHQFMRCSHSPSRLQKNTHGPRYPKGRVITGLAAIAELAPSTQVITGLAAIAELAPSTQVSLQV